MTSPARLEVPRCSERFDDGDALYAAGRELGLEGVAAKKRSSRYRPGQRG